MLLLEVVLSVAILALAMAILGTQIHVGWEDSYSTEELTSAVFLAESKLAELDSGLLTFEDDMDGDFGEAFPGFGWRVHTEPSDIVDLLEVEISILRGLRFEAGEEYVYDDESPVIFALHSLRRKNVTTGTQINVETDLGIPLAELDSGPSTLPPEATAALDLLQTLLPNFPDVNLRDLVNLPPEELLGLLEALKATGFDPTSALSGGIGGLGQDAQGLLDDAAGQLGGQAGETQGGGTQEGGEQGNPTDALPSGDRLPSLEEFQNLMNQRGGGQ